MDDLHFLTIFSILLNLMYTYRTLFTAATEVSIILIHFSVEQCLSW